MPSDEKHVFSYLAPIPTYEEATSSRPSSSNSRRGPEEISDDAERQGLLHHDEPTRRSNYVPPAVESARTSVDSLDALEVDEEADVRREMQEMDIEEPATSRTPLSNRFKRFANFTNPFHSFRQLAPNFKWRWPQIDWQALDANRIVIVGRLFGVMILGGLMYLLFAADLITFGSTRSPYVFRPDVVRSYVMDTIQEGNRIPEYLQKITQYPHVAGTEGNYVLGQWVEEVFKEAKLDKPYLERFDVYLNYPRKDGRRVAIVSPKDQQWEAKIEEDNEETYVFHGHAASGDVTGPLIYANFGSREDFAHLQALGVDLRGSIVLVRYYGTETDRALKVKAAELAGAKACIIYSDPAQDGAVLGPTFPDGRFMPEDGVQRGAVSLMSWVVGDVLSPGFAATPGEKRRDRVHDSLGLNKIPSMPLSWRDARHLLTSLQGHGRKLEGNWTGEPHTEYWTGDMATSPHVNLRNEQDEELRQPIYNVLAQIQGWETSAKKVVIGNHRDAWCTGAADPGSGTAILLELARVFGALVDEGWKPLRTIEFASWDGEEYNLIGSTEHVEQFGEADTVAYINVDVGVTGIDLKAAGSPLLTRALRSALHRVLDPQTNEALFNRWSPDGQRGLAGLGAGSDYVAYQCLAGVPSIDLSFTGDKFPYHSCYDNYVWMEKFGDTQFAYHKTLAQILGLIILDLADHALLPLDLDAYVTSLNTYIDRLDRDINGALPVNDLKQEQSLDVEPLRAAVRTISPHVVSYQDFDNAWHAQIMASGGFETTSMAKQRHSRNDRLGSFERHLRSTEGIVNRTQFKHVVFGPQKWSGYDEAFFPGIRDYIEAGEMRNAQDEVVKVADIIVQAAQSLGGG